MAARKTPWVRLTLATPLPDRETETVRLAWAMQSLLKDYGLPVLRVENLENRDQGSGVRGQKSRVQTPIQRDLFG